MTRRLRWSAVIAIAVLAGLAWLSFSSVTAHGPVKPKLFVLVVFDQLRGDYLARWHDCFGSDGFRRLEREGTWFTNCHYPYAGTQTGPGHASLSTGCSADRHGIVANDWFERAKAATVHCTTSIRYQNVYSVPPPPEAQKTPAKADEPEKAKEPKPTAPAAPIDCWFRRSRMAQRSDRRPIESRERRFR